VILKVAGEVAAGSEFRETLQPGYAVRIMTGAPVPPGADAVQKFEVTEDVEGGVRIDEAVRPGQNIGPRGGEVKKGSTIIPGGTRVSAGEIAVLATFGRARVRVARRPSMGLFATGTELVDVDVKPGPAQIRNSNSHALRAYAREAGIEAINLGILPDDPDRLREGIRRGIESYDLLVLSGGVSMGDYDLVKSILLELKAEILFDKVCIHPGKPTVFARRGERLVFGLPGNPVSVAVTFLMFAYPALLALQGATGIDLPRVRAVLAGDVTHNPDRRSYFPAKLSIQGGSASVAQLRWVGSSDLVAFRLANALLVIREDVERASKGDLAETVLLPGCAWKMDQG
jgi:molybdopterin molybdotransferase